MTSQYCKGEDGIYRCRRCGMGLEPKHSLVCKGEKSKVEIEDDEKTSKAGNEQTGTDLAAGFEILGASEE